MQPPTDDSIHVEVKYTKTVDEVQLQALKELGVQFMTPLKINEELPTGGLST